VQGCEKINANLDQLFPVKIERVLSLHLFAGKSTFQFCDPRIESAQTIRHGFDDWLIY